MSGKKWSTIDAVVGIIGGICGVIGIISGIKSSNYHDEQMYLELEERYGLEPVEETEEA